MCESLKADTDKKWRKVLSQTNAESFDLQADTKCYGKLIVHKTLNVTPLW